VPREAAECPKAGCPRGDRMPEGRVPREGRECPERPQSARRPSAPEATECPKAECRERGEGAPRGRRMPEGRVPQRRLNAQRPSAARGERVPREATGCPKAECPRGDRMPECGSDGGAYKGGGSSSSCCGHATAERHEPAASGARYYRTHATAPDAGQSRPAKAAATEEPVTAGAEAEGQMSADRCNERPLRNSDELPACAQQALRRLPRNCPPSSSSPHVESTRRVRRAGRDELEVGGARACE
jgi:hypothetical protein